MKLSCWCEGFLSFRTKCIYRCISTRMFALHLAFLDKMRGPLKSVSICLADLLTSSIASIAFNCFLDCFFTFRLRLALRWSLKTFPKSAWLCFCRNFVFSLRSIEATCDGEVPVTPNNTFFLLSYIIVLLHFLINNTVLPKNSRTVSICTVLGLPLHLFNHNPQFW